MFMMKKIALVILLITGLCIGSVLAIPVMPDEWYGSVYLNGNPAPVGTVIVIQVNGQVAGQLTTTKEGLYGSQSGPDSLYASVTEDTLTKGPVTVTFLVNGIQAFQAVPFEPGNLTKLDIYADSKTMPTSPPTLAPSSLSDAGAGSGASQPSAGGFPVLSAIPTTSGQTAPAKAGTSAPAQPGGSSATGSNGPAGQKPSAGNGGNAPSSAVPSQNMGSAGSLPAGTTLGILIVVVVIVIAGAYVMRKKGKI